MATFSSVLHQRYVCENLIGVLFVSADLVNPVCLENYRHVEVSKSAISKQKNVGTQQSDDDRVFSTKIETLFRDS